MLLAIDVGNSNVVIGCFDGDKPLPVETVSGMVDTALADII